MKFDVSALRGLQGKDLSGEGLLVLEGRIVVEKAMDAGTKILGTIRGNEADATWLEARRPDFPIETVSGEELAELVGFRFHHGVLALAERPSIPPFLPAALASEGSGRVGLSGPEADSTRLLCLWNVTDPSNLGALLRSAVGLGAAAVLLGPGCADPFYRKALRASMGNALALPIYACDYEALRTAKASGLSLVAATLSPHAVPLAEFSPRPPLALLLGNEGFGLPSEVVELCDDEVYIPMRPGLDSLNVAVAGGILMYELFRRR